jgi:hypothetical protein
MQTISNLTMQFSMRIFWLKFEEKVLIFHVHKKDNLIFISSEKVEKNIASGRKHTSQKINWSVPN